MHLGAEEGVLKSGDKAFTKLKKKPKKKVPLKCPKIN